MSNLIRNIFKIVSGNGACAGINVTVPQQRSDRCSRFETSLHEFGCHRNATLHERGEKDGGGKSRKVASHCLGAEVGVGWREGVLILI